MPNVWYNLGRLQRRVGQSAAALSAYQQALDRRITRPEEAHLNRAVIFSDDLQQAELAEHELVTALSLNPSYIPALLNLANIHEDLGRRDAAGETYERALAVDPRCFDALARHANLTRFTDRNHPLLVRLREAATDSSLSAADRATVGFALGRALDQLEDYGEAFSAYSAANDCSHRSSGAVYDRAVWERIVDRLIAAFPAHTTQTATTQTAATGTAAAVPRPIFVCGMYRSGSTLTEQLLASHPRITAGGELGILPHIAQRLLTSHEGTLPAEVLAEASRFYLQTLRGLFPGAELVTDKRPDNFTLIGLIKSVFPQSRIVHTVRNPLDNCLSLFFLHLDQQKSYALNLMDAGHFYRHYVRLMAHWKRSFGPDIFAVRYDVLVREPRRVMEPLLSFLDLAWDERCLEVSPKARAIRTASVWQVREPLYQHASGRARHYAEQLAPLREYLQDLEEEQ